MANISKLLEDVTIFYVVLQQFYLYDKFVKVQALQKCQGCTHLQKCAAMDSQVYSTLKPVPLHTRAQKPVLVYTAPVYTVALCMRHQMVRTEYFTHLAGQYGVKVVVFCSSMEH